MTNLPTWSTDFSAKIKVKNIGVGKKLVDLKADAGRLVSVVKNIHTIATSLV